ncbi:MAG: 2-hydroxy-3-oxopropionate reductase [SAR202 cluster bacterium]|nr:2-hydroxy-3-oxopropionate reductase [SAR202 cluster bacterium]
MKIGFVGLGIMGKPMAKNLLKAGYEVVAYDIVGEALEEVVSEGAESGESPKDVAQKTTLIITMLPDGPDVEKVVLGTNGVLEGAQSGSVIIDMSSISPIVAKNVYSECKKKGIELLDAPVSGGEPGAISGTLAIMVGGSKTVFDKYLPVMEVLGKSVVLAGDIGAGNITKLANQIMVAVNIAGMGEALVLAAKAGVDPSVVFEAVRGGLAGSSVLEAKGPMVLDGNFKPGFRIRLHQKDLNNALITAKELGVTVPLTGLVQQMITSLVNSGNLDNDHSAIVRFIEELSGTEARRFK